MMHPITINHRRSREDAHGVTSSATVVQRILRSERIFNGELFLRRRPAAQDVWENNT